MIINLKKFNKYKRIISNIIKKYNPYTESLFFNVSDGFCHFQNEEVFGRLRIEKDEAESNLFINAEKFLLLSSNLDEIELKNRIFIYNEDNFKLGNYGELNYEVPSYENYENYEEYDCILQNKELFNSLREAFHYIEREPTNSYNAIFIDNNHIIATDRSRFYLKKLESISDIYLQESLMKILLYLDDSDLTVIKKLDNKIMLKINDELEILINRNTNLVVPKILEAHNSYNHNTFVKCDLKEFYNLVQFLLPFTSSDSFNKIILKVENEKILISIQEEDININKYIDIKETNLTSFDKEYILCCSDLKLLLSHLQGQDLNIQLSPESMINDRFTMLCFSSDQDINKKIILPTMEG